MSDHLAVADQLFAAILGGDLEAVRALYADDAQIWHSNDGIVQTRDENLVVLGWVIHHLKDMRYDDIVRVETTTGFVQEHVLRATANGTAIEMPACIVVTVVDGRISRLNEYLDSARIQALTDAFR